jgi:hypothetical protein
MQFNYNVKPIDFSAYFKGKAQYDEKERQKKLDEQAERDKGIKNLPTQLGTLYSLVSSPEYSGMAVSYAKSIAESNKSMAPDVTKWIRTYQNPETRSIAINQLAGINKRLGISQMPADVIGFERLTENMTPEDKEQARRVKLGLEPRASSSAQERIAVDPGLTQDVAESQATIVGSRERAGGDQQIVTEDAKNRNKDTLEQEKKARSNQESFRLYEAGLAGIAEAAGSPWSGSIIGLLPAISDGQRVVDGAADILFNAIKPIFKGAAEGTFTDDDAMRIYNMLPTRRDSEEVAEYKLKAVDALIRAKLNISSAGGQEMTPEMQRELEELRAARKRGDF